MKYDCRHCVNNTYFDGHSYVCNCGHTHDEHVFCGPCLRAGCICDAYKQTQQIPYMVKPIRLVPKLAKGASV